MGTIEPRAPRSPDSYLLWPAHTARTSWRRAQGRCRTAQSNPPRHRHKATTTEECVESRAAQHTDHVVRRHDPDRIVGTGDGGCASQADRAGPLHSYKQSGSFLATAWSVRALCKERTSREGQS